MVKKIINAQNANTKYKVSSRTLLNSSIVRHLKSSISFSIFGADVLRDLCSSLADFNEDMLGHKEFIFKSFTPSSTLPRLLSRIPSR